MRRDTSVSWLSTFLVFRRSVSRGIVSRGIVLGGIVLGGIVLGAMSAGCYRSHDRPLARPLDAGTDAVVSPPDRDATVARPLVWVLVHSSSVTGEPGLFLFDENRQAVVRRLPLPSASGSPHGLAWDRGSLWLSSVAPSEILQLDADTGEVRARIPGVQAEGIAAAPDGTLWYGGRVDGSASLRAVNVTPSGEERDAIVLPEVTVQDLTLARDTLYYLVNDDLDRLMRLDRSGARSTVALVPSVAPYSLAFDGISLAVAVDGVIHRFDPESGELRSSDPFAVPGWITAITFVR